MFCIYAVILVVKAGKGKVPMIFGYGILNVVTGSMVPVINPGDVIIVKKIDASEIKKDDVICFYSTDPSIFGLPNTHRVIEVGKDENGRLEFTTKGDANSLEDEYKVPWENVVGKEIKVIKHVDKIIKVIQNRYFFFFVLVIPLVGVVFIEILNISKVTKKNGGRESDGENKETDKDGGGHKE
ncbi:MAG: signal peptidase I [Clostridiales bacterium]|nr:signal peptidase I [Clostridiales bacterium]